MLSAQVVCVRAAAAERGGLDRDSAEFVMLTVRVVCEGLVTCCHALAQRQRKEVVQAAIDHVASLKVYLCPTKFQSTSCHYFLS